MNRALLLLMFAAALLAGCGPPAPTAQAPKADPTTEAWYSKGVDELTAMNREALEDFGHRPWSLR